GATSLEGLGYAGRFLVDNGFDVVAFKANRNWWFQDLGPAVFDAVEQAIARGGRSYRRRVGYGSSMGGYAAFQFSGALKLDRVVAYSPQFSIHEAWEPRWAREAAAIDFAHAMTRAALAPDCRFVVVYDPCNPDIEHVRRFAAIVPEGRLRELRLRYSGHPSGDFIAETGHLKAFALALLRGDTPPPVASIRRDRAKSHAYLRTLAASCLERAKPRAALALIDRALAIAPKRPLYHWQRSLILDRLGRAEECLAAGRQAHALAPDDALYALHLTHLLSRKGDAIGALATLDRALAVDPDNAGGLRQRALLLDHLGDAAGAAQAQRRAFALDSKNPHQAALLSHLLVRSGDIAEALASIDQAITREPGVAAFHRHRSALLDRLKESDGAVAAAERAVALAPDDAESLMQLSHVLARKGLIEAALDCAARATLLVPGAAWHHRHLGALQDRAGRLDLAIVALREAVKLGPDEPSHALHLQALLRRRGDGAVAAAQ
ncbi:MAG: tetratricopeptide repeat protein, partial [Rhodospirillales bacterium]|nr:tetratricopeptide repeat protein [Rhodospirillales bacterium]